MNHPPGSPSRFGSFLLLNLGIAQIVSGQLLSNGSFEIPALNDGPTDTHIRRIDAPASFGGWVVESGNVHVTSHYRWQVEVGIQALDLNGNQPGVIYQDAATIPGHAYQLSFLMGGDVSGGAVLKTMDLWWGPSAGGLTKITNFTYDSTGQTLINLQWTRHTISNLVATGASSRLRFYSTTPDGWGPGIDDVSLVDVGQNLGATLALSITNGLGTLRLAGHLGYGYQFEYATNSFSAVWVPITNITLAASPDYSLAVGPVTGSSRFYRTKQTSP